MDLSKQISALVEPEDRDKISKDKKDWSLSNIPPQGHEDLGPFVYQLYIDARDEKKRLRKPETWTTSYNYFKGNHWNNRKDIQSKVTVNLFFANVLRTVANIVNRNPVAEVKSLTAGDEAGQMTAVWTRKLEQWWVQMQQHKKLRSSVINNEVYGATFEKPFWNKQLQAPDTVIVDPFAFFPAPGYWEDISLDCPYVAHAVPQKVTALQAKYSNDEIGAEDYYYELGREREEHVPVQARTTTTNATYTSGGRTYLNTNAGYDDSRTNMALETEIWIRDKNTPGGIRCITVTNEGRIVLADKPNPLINWNLQPEQYKTGYLYKRLPFFKANSYADTSSIWGFSALDQTYDLVVKVEELISMAIAYHMRSAYGVMLVAKRSGIKRSQLSNKPGLVLFPDSDVDQIKFLQLPSLPASYFTLVDTLIELHDRVYAVQDADRGQAPSGVVAASAIVALQEKNAVLIQEKIDSVEKLVEHRGNCAIALWQQHGHMPESVTVEGETFTVKGTDFAGTELNYLVQSGSLMTKTRIDKQEQSAELYKEGAIDAEALLTDLDYQGKDDVLERMNQGQYDIAVSVLVQAGVPEEQALAMIEDIVAEPGVAGSDSKTGTADMAGGAQMPAPGQPKTEQGAVV